MARLEPVDYDPFGSNFDAPHTVRPSLDSRARDYAVRTVLGEAANQGADGMAAVANVIRNRMEAGRYGGKDAVSVITKPYAFEPWNTQAGRQRMSSYSPDSEPYRMAAEAVDAVFAGAVPDITGGATHFVSPSVQASMGRNMPSWAKGDPLATIGAHAFYAPEGKVSSGKPTQTATPNLVPVDHDPFASTPSAPVSPVEHRFGAGVPSAAAGDLEAGLRKRADQMLVGPDSATNSGETFLREAANTALLNIPRNVEAGVRSVVSGDPFATEYERLKSREDALARLNPVSAGVGTGAGIVGGALALPGISGGATVGARALRAGATAAGYGAVSELLDSKDPVKAAVAAGLGGALGIVAAPVAEKIVNVLSKAVRSGRADARFINPDGTLTPEAIQAARDAGVSPDDFSQVLTRAYAAKFQERGATPATARDVAADEFSIKLSPGQSSGDFSRIKYEQDAARGGYGPFAQRAAGKFFDDQGKQIATARSGIQGEVAGVAPVVPNVGEAVDVARSGIRNAAAQAKGDFRGKYNAALSGDGEFSDIAFVGVGSRIKRALSDRDNPVIVDDIITPIAKRALDTIDSGLSRLRIKNAADPLGQPDPSKIVGVNLRGVDQARKQLVSFYSAAKAKAAGGDATDLRAMRHIIDAFDDEIEQAMTTGLFSGSDDVLKALKDARASYSKYRATFTNQGRGDSVGSAIQRIVERDATASEVANMLYGKAAIGERGTSVNLAKRIKEILGDGSEEMSAVKQGLWMRLTSKPEGVDDFGPQAMSQRIYKFINGDGAEMARAIFTRDEIAKIGRFAASLKNVAPPKEAVNWSNTAYTMASLQGGGLGAAGLYFGADPQTAAALAGLRVGGKFARDIVRGRSASKYFASGAPSLPPPSPGASITQRVGVGLGLADDDIRDRMLGAPR